MTPILVDVHGASILLTLSERGFHELRKRPDFPPDATVILGPRAVRFRVDVLSRYAQELSTNTAPHSEPEQLRRARQNRRESQAV